MAILRLLRKEAHGLKQKQRKKKKPYSVVLFGPRIRSLLDLYSHKTTEKNTDTRNPERDSYLRFHYEEYHLLGYDAV
jgi:hypothetical protein